MSNTLSQQRFLALQAYQQVHLLALRAASAGLNDLHYTRVVKDKEAERYLATLSYKGKS